MATTIDHLRVDHRVTILRDFTDMTGLTLHAGDCGVLRKQSFDQIRNEILIEIEREKGDVALRFPLKTPSGPRIGHMKEFFELGDYVAVPGSEPVGRDPLVRKMIVPTPKNAQGENSGPDWWQKARNTEGPDRLKEL